jgi:hypothetical protein
MQGDYTIWKKTHLNVLGQNVGYIDPNTISSNPCLALKDSYLKSGECEGVAKMTLRDGDSRPILKDTFVESRISPRWQRNQAMI